MAEIYHIGSTCDLVCKATWCIVLFLVFIFPFGALFGWFGTFLSAFTICKKFHAVNALLCFGIQRVKLSIKKQLPLRRLSLLSGILEDMEEDYRRDNQLILMNLHMGKVIDRNCTVRGVTGESWSIIGDT